MIARASRSPERKEIRGEMCLNGAGVARWLFEMDAADGREMRRTKPNLWALIEAYQRKVRARLLIEPSIDDAIAAVFDLDLFEHEILTHGSNAPRVALVRVTGGGAS